MTRFIIAAAIALSATMAQAHASPTEIIRRDDGGEIDVYARKIEAMALMGERVAIVGECASACTMYLAVGCVAPTAKLGFHGPQSGMYGIALPPDEHARYVKIMARHYPPAIAAWFVKGPSRKVLGLTWISAADAVKMGATPCK